MWNPSAIDAKHIVPKTRHNVYLFTIILGCLLRNIARFVGHGLYNCTTNNEQRVAAGVNQKNELEVRDPMGYESSLNALLMRVRRHFHSNATWCT